MTSFQLSVLLSPQTACKIMASKIKVCYPGENRANPYPIRSNPGGLGFNMLSWSRTVAQWQKSLS